MRELPRLEGEPETRSPRNRANANAGPGGPDPVAGSVGPVDWVRRGLCLIFWVSAAGAGYSLAAWFATEGRNGSGPLGHFWLAAAVALAGLAAPGRAASPPARG